MTAPSAKIQAFGLTSWNAAADTSPNGRATSVCSSAPARTTGRQPQQVDRAGHLHRGRQLGTAATIAPAATAARSAIAPIPSAVPRHAAPSAESRTTPRRPTAGCCSVPGDRAHDREPDECGELFHDRTVDGVAGAVLYDPARHGVPERTDGPRLEATDPRRPRGAARSLHGPRVSASHPRRLDALHRRRRRRPVRPWPARSSAEPSMVSVLPPHVVHDGRPRRPAASASGSSTSSRSSWASRSSDRRGSAGNPATGLRRSLRPA